MVLEATGRDMTLTDRTLIWTDVLNDAAKSPVLGVGMGAFWVGPMGYDMYPMPNWSRKTPEWRPEEGHDGYIDVYAELGVVGVALLLMVIVNGFTGAFADLQSDFKFGSLRLVLLLSIIMNNVAETSFLKGTHDLWFLFLLVSVNVPKPVRKTISGRDSTVTDHSVNQHEQLLANQILQLSPIPQHN
jgi:O-antigen ligase